VTYRTESQREASRENGKKGGRPKLGKEKTIKYVYRNIVPEINRVAYVELARTCSNLNQIAHHFNENGFDSNQVDEVYKILQELRLLISGVANDR
jgi:hypothetical protein